MSNSGNKEKNIFTINDDDQGKKKSELSMFICPSNKEEN